MLKNSVPQIKLRLKKRVFNERYYHLLNKYDSRVMIAYGGAASGKSHFLAQRYVYQVMKGGRNILAVRKVGTTLRDSLFPLFKKIISEWGVEHLFKINKSDYTITCVNGYKIICRGLDDPEKIKSITCEKGIITDIWLEEATEFSEEDFNQLGLRLRGKSKLRKQIVMSFNPISQLHWIKKRFFDTVSDDVYILKTTYKDNAFLEDDDIADIEKLKDVDEVYYQVYALGNWGSLGNLVYTNWEVRDLSEIRTSFNAFYNGLDFGYTNHPTGFIRVAFKDDTIYVFDEVYQKGLKNNEIAQEVKPYVNDEAVFCDCAEPKSIDELCDYGLRAYGVAKGRDSVRHGIQWIRQKRIVIDPGCQNFINEIQIYKYRKTKDGIVLNDPVDLNNHLMDALRYALEEMILNYNGDYEGIACDFI